MRIRIDVAFWSVQSSLTDACNHVWRVAWLSFFRPERSFRLLTVIKKMFETSPSNPLLKLLEFVV